MKCLLFVLFVFVGCMAAENDEEEFFERFADLFSIGINDIRTCVANTTVKRAHMIAFEDALDDEDSSKEVSVEALRKASCYLACCAEKQGTMVGPKLQMQKIEQLIRNMKHRSLLPQMKLLLINYTKQCNDQVMNLTDACDVVLVFVKCYHERLEKTKF